VHLLRAQSDAIMVGIGTVLADDPLLTCRLLGMEKASPVRIVLDSALRLPPDSRLAQSARDVPVWVFCGPQAAGAAAAALKALGVEVLRAEASGDRLDLAAVLRLLAGRGITRLMVEGGPTLAASLLAADLVDEAVLFRSSSIVGADGIDALAGLPLTALTQWPHLAVVSSDPIGADIRQVFARR
jgi:diaminohydroxyphosphoribosylaminopyrimidine deaminase/5-amino-6-(5-phosphoribosylamino)uracil reductase